MQNVDGFECELKVCSSFLLITIIIHFLILLKRFVGSKSEHFSKLSHESFEITTPELQVGPIKVT